MNTASTTPGTIVTLGSMALTVVVCVFRNLGMLAPAPQTENL